MNRIMECKLIEKKLIFYIEDELDARESALVKAHIDNCQACNYIFGRMKQNLDFIKDDILSVSNPFFHTRVMAAIQNQKRASHSWIKQKQLILQTATYGFIIIFALIAGIFLGSGNAVNEQALMEDQADTTDYQLFANSYKYHFSKDVYVVESTTNEK